jgi:hypothetical protein
MRKSVILGLLAFGVAVSLLVLPLKIQAAPSGWAHFFGLAATVKSPGELSEVVARVGAVDITVKGLRLSRAMLQAAAFQQGQDPQAVTMAKALDAQKVVAVQIAEAQRRGITVSDTEVADVVSQQRSVFDSLQGADKEEMTAAIQAMGFSVDQYWKEVPASYKEMLLIVKLRAQVYATVATDDGTPEGLKAKMDAYNRFLESLMKTSDFHVIRPDLVR